MKIRVDLTHEEIVGVMRALSRAYPETPENERDLHKELWVTFGEWHVQTLPAGVVERLGFTLDRASGRGR